MQYDPRMIYTFHDEIHLVFFYNGNGNDAAGGLILQKGWTRTSMQLLTFAEENDTAYSMAAPATS